MPTRFAWVREGFLLAIDECVSRQSLRDAAGVRPNTYGAELVDRMLWLALDGLVDVAADYKRYYVPEYGSLQEYLVRRLGVEPDVATQFAAEVGPSRLVAFGQMKWKGDWILSQWIESEPGGKALRQLLQCEEATDEDQK